LDRYQLDNVAVDRANPIRSASSGACGGLELTLNVIPIGCVWLADAQNCRSSRGEWRDACDRSECSDLKGADVATW
jgi:hypothetical protein